jgi:superfamily I DNA/RNA helicase
MSSSKDIKSIYDAKFREEYKRLNPQQKLAVDTIEGPVLVIAGPGTGKTQIIAARIANILAAGVDAKPHNIICLTYTDAGAIAMRLRLLEFIGPLAHKVNIYTYHAFCNDVASQSQLCYLHPLYTIFFLPSVAVWVEIFTCCCSCRQGGSCCCQRDSARPRHSPARTMQR